jgi:hypothetical protein
LLHAGSRLITLFGSFLLAGLLPIVFLAGLLGVVSGLGILLQKEKKARLIFVLCKQSKGWSLVEITFQIHSNLFQIYSFAYSFFEVFIMIISFYLFQDFQ